MTTAPLEVKGLRKTFTSKTAVVRAIDNVSFTIKEGELYTLLGPSGCGKTSTLRSVAGLEHPDEGVISISGREVCRDKLSVPPNKRDIGMVFQNYGIWPHMTVFENAAFPLRVSKQRISKQEMQQRVEEALAAVHLEGFAGRASNQMSGGQQQRLALARALVSRPKILLLDEPLSNLDAKLRNAMRAEITKLQRELGIATLFVTHDQEEALSMSTKIAVMNAGAIVQEGKPREIYQRPVNKFVADFVGRTNFIAGKVESGRIRTDAGMFDIHNAGAEGSEFDLSVRPESIKLHPERPVDGTLNILEGQLVRSMYVGERADCHVLVAGNRWLVRIDPFERVEPGSKVWLEILPERVTVLAS